MITIISVAVMPLLSLAIGLTFIRLLIGPDLPDRVVALDLLALLAVGLIMTLALYYQEARLFDLAIVLSLIAFLGTIAFARFLEKGAP